MTNWITLWKNLLLTQKKPDTTRDGKREIKLVWCKNGWDLSAMSPHPTGCCIEQFRTHTARACLNQKVHTVSHLWMIEKNQKRKTDRLAGNWKWTLIGRDDCTTVSRTPRTDSLSVYSKRFSHPPLIARSISSFLRTNWMWNVSHWRHKKKGFEI